jgi:DNA polymerase epsilon subunit 2
MVRMEYFMSMFWVCLRRKTVVTRGKSIPNSSAALSNHVDLFGGLPFHLDRHQLLDIERKSEDVSFVILSDVWLDQPQVFEKLKVMFKGYSEAIIPTLFVFIGNFQSTSFVQGSNHTTAYKESFDQLANLIAQYPNIAKKSQFVFVPGFNDPWANSTLPRPPLPSIFTRKLSMKLRNVHFPGNPCRIKYCTQEIIIFREDLMNMMRRNQVLPIAKEQELTLERHVY